jgi:hypothetical protein
MLLEKAIQTLIKKSTQTPAHKTISLQPKKQRGKKGLLCLLFLFLPYLPLFIVIPV